MGKPTRPRRTVRDTDISRVHRKMSIMCKFILKEEGDTRVAGSNEEWKVSSGQSAAKVKTNAKVFKRGSHCGGTSEC